MTYSIVARDPQTGEFGVAVQSHYFTVGSIVPWARAGVGAVATQAIAETSFGPNALERMAQGATAEEALSGLIGRDADSTRRQVGMVDTAGIAAAHTGGRCIAHAGHRIGAGVSVQANMMERDTVPDAMLAAYASANGDLSERLLTALDAAEGEGGDIRGRQSAAILIVAGERGAQPQQGRLLDQRVDDSPDPLRELRRLVMLQRSYHLAGEAEAAATKGDVGTARAKLMEAMQLAPDNVEIAFWAAMAAAAIGQVEMAKGLLARAVAVDPRWNELVRRLPASGIFALGDETIEALTGS